MASTTTKAGNKAKSMSKNARAATGGNKNVQSRARRMSAESQGGAAMRTFRRTHNGPKS